MSRTILVTGGAGFIGRHVVATLLHRGCQVRVLDSFVEQVHGNDGSGSAKLRDAELRIGDICHFDTVKAALAGADAVIHLAAEVGVGQSMYEIMRYVGANDLGTAALLEAMLESDVRRIVVASSMSIYGEGLYRAGDGRLVDTVVRHAPRPGAWDPVEESGGELTPAPTPESKRPSLASVYAVTKFAQERLVLSVGAAYGWHASALRLFNVFGPGQALSNPYTGVLAIFAARLLNGQRPMAFEDGLQRRDFVHVADVAEAFALALETPAASGRAINIGSGRSYSVSDVASLLAEAMGRPDLSPEILEKSRAGDIRHCFSDISLARTILGFRPTRMLEEGVGELAEWVAQQRSACDRVPQARQELERRGLVA